MDATGRCNRLNLSEPRAPCVCKVLFLLNRNEVFYGHLQTLIVKNQHFNFASNLNSLTCN